MTILPRPVTLLHEGEQPRTVAAARLASIDQFRGFAVLAMVFGNYIIGISYLPDWLKHSPDIGLTVIDLGAPWFIFAISLTVGLSAGRRVRREGWAAMIGHGFTRSMALVGIGAIFGTFQIGFGMNPGGVNWGVLQAIGVANFLTLLAIGLPVGVRLALGLALLGGYQALLDRFWLDVVLASPHGGIQGAMAWTAMLMLGTVLADQYHSGGGRRALLPWLGAALLVAGMLLTAWVPVSKPRVSASYVLIALGVSTLLFMLFAYLTDRLDLRSPLLMACGRNPLALYLIHQVMLGLVVLPGIPGWYAEAAPPLVLIQLAAMVGAIGWIGRELDRRGWYFTL